MMKKLFACLLAAGLVAGAAHAQTNEVLSRNAVGYVKIDLPAGLKLISTPFINLDGSLQTLDDVFGENPGASTTVYVWNQDELKYTTYRFFDPPGTWVDLGTSSPGAGTNVLQRGDAVWVRSPTGGELFIMGQVPGDDIPIEDVHLPEGLRLMSFSYPVSISVEDVGLNPIASDTIYAWHGSGYKTYRYFSPPGAWVDVDESVIVNDLKLEPGVGYWYRTSSARTWEQVKPYQWP